jgi:hypothetical protein
MFETEILEYLHEHLRLRLGSANESRTFYTQNILSTSGFSSSIASTLMTGLVSENSAYRSDVHGDISYAAVAINTSIEASTSLLSVPDYRDVEERADSSIGEVLDASAVSSPPVIDSLKRKIVESSKPNIAPNKLVRTDSSLLKIDAFFKPMPLQNIDPNLPPSHSRAVDASISYAFREKVTVHPQEPLNADAVVGAFARAGRCICCKGLESCISVESALPDSTAVLTTPFSLSPAPMLSSADFVFQETTCEYDSVMTMLLEMQNCRHTGYEHMLKKHAFIGVVDATYCLVQVPLKFLLDEFSSLISSCSLVRK